MSLLLVRASRAALLRGRLSLGLRGVSELKTKYDAHVAERLKTGVVPKVTRYPLPLGLNPPSLSTLRTPRL